MLKVLVFWPLLTAIQARPTGLVSEPPPGPAIPEMEQHLLPLDPAKLKDENADLRWFIEGFVEQYNKRILELTAIPSGSAS